MISLSLSIASSATLTVEQERKGPFSLDCFLQYLLVLEGIMSANAFCLASTSAMDGLTKFNVLKSSPKLFWKGMPKRMILLSVWSFKRVFQI